MLEEFAAHIFHIVYSTPKRWKACHLLLKCCDSAQHNHEGKYPFFLFFPNRQIACGSHWNYGATSFGVCKFSWRLLSRVDKTVSSPSLPSLFFPWRTVFCLNCSLLPSTMLSGCSAVITELHRASPLADKLSSSAFNSEKCEKSESEKPVHRHTLQREQLTRQTTILRESRAQRVKF